MSTATPVAPKPWHRPDITGLRSLAIIPVVVFHAGISQIPGGFIGVDMFYVISGFLITTLLVRDATERRLHLGQFWARRLRRLLPASVVMVAATLIAGLFILSPFRWEQLGKEALSSIFYVSNFVFANQSTDYFAQDVAIPSPLIHTWSLGVEEQFYIFWPLIIILVAALTRKRGNIRVALFSTFAVLTAASITLSVIWTVSSPQVAFYLLPTRVWEFALAGMLAIAFPYLAVPGWLRTSFGIVGFAGIGASLFVIDSTTPYPGTAAFLPVIATMLVILAGPRPGDVVHSWPTRILSTRPFVWIGDVSYSWYLWHWPFIVLAPIALQNKDLWVTLVAALASLGVATLSYKFLENPIRFHPRLVRSIRLTLVFSLVAVLPVSAGAIATMQAGTEKAVEPVVIQGVDKPLDLQNARFPPKLDPCDRKTKLATGQTLCESGDLDSDRILLLVGDSHAGHWRLALSDAARAEGMKLVVKWEAGCPVIPVEVVPNEGREFAAPCAGFRKGLTKLIKDIQPEAVVVSQSDGYWGRISTNGTKVASEATQVSLWRKGFTQFVETQSPNTKEIAVIIDNPRNDFDPNDCLSKPGSTPESCASPLEEVIDDVEPLHQATIDVLAEVGVTATLDTRAMLCDDGICRVVDGDLPVYRDFNHLSRQWTVSKVPELREFIQEIVAEEPQ